MEDGLDVVAIRLAEERAEMAGVVFGPRPGLVQRLGSEFDCGVVERAHGVDVRGLKGDVDFSVRAEVGPGYPEGGLAVGPVADDLPKSITPGVAEHAKNPVVEVLGLAEIAAVETEVIDHRPILARRAGVAVQSFT